MRKIKLDEVLDTYDAIYSLMSDGLSDNHVCLSRREVKGTIRVEGGNRALHEEIVSQTKRLGRLLDVREKDCFLMQAHTNGLAILDIWWGGAMRIHAKNRADLKAQLETSGEYALV
jgi:hypothetical protein